jgi:recombination protein RecA
MFSASAVRLHVETRIPSAFSAYKRPELRTIPTGISAIDQLTKGVPVSALSEICGVGKTSVLLSLLAQATQQEHYCALVDAKDSFDPASARAIGIDLNRLLWIRCGKSKQELPPLEQAFRAADLLIQGGGFGIVAVDLSNFSERLLNKIQPATWFRFAHVVEKQDTALVFLEPRPFATSCAGLVLNLRNKSQVWRGKLLSNLEVEVEVVRTRNKKSSQSVRPELSLKTQWT